MVISKLLILIMYNALISRKDLSVLLTRVVLVINILTIYLIVKTLYIPILDKGIGIYNGVFQFNSSTHIFNIFIFILANVIITLNGFYPRKVLNNEKDIFYKAENTSSTIEQYIWNNQENENLKPTNINTISTNFKVFNNNVFFNKKSEQYTIKEYVLIILFVLIGAIFLISSNDLISIFLAIELQSYGLYILSTIYRDSELSTKAGLTYFLLGGLSSCIILLGQSLLYINSGNTNLDNIYILSDLTLPMLQLTGNENIYSLLYYIPKLYDYFYINLSLLIFCAGFMFKVSAAPFHFWSPDVYDSIPTVVTTFVAIIAKISIFVLFLDLVSYTGNIYFKSSWTNNLLFSCLLSLIIGSVLGLTQSRIKRLYAYSTINHIGFILLALTINKLESIQAFIFYIIQYSLSNLNAFIILIAMGYFLFIYYNENKEYIDLKEKNNSPIQLISQIKGFYLINPILSLSLAISLLSFLGVPPLLGFFGKQMVLSSALDNGYVFITLIAILTSVISGVYYLIVVKQIFFDRSEYIELINKDTNIKKDILRLSSNLSISISILTILILAYMFTSKIFLDLLTILSLFIFNL